MSITCPTLLLPCRPGHCNEFGRKRCEQAARAIVLTVRRPRTGAYVRCLRSVSARSAGDLRLAGFAAREGTGAPFRHGAVLGCRGPAARPDRRAATLAHPPRRRRASALAAPLPFRIEHERLGSPS